MMKCKKVLKDNIPSKLKQRKQWVSWRYTLDKNGYKFSKIQINSSTGNYAVITDQKKIKYNMTTPMDVFPEPEIELTDEQ